MSRAPRSNAGPLAGIRVVALEQSVAGPMASRILADMGADVVKVESPAGDFARHWDGHVRGLSSHFAWLSRRKRSIALRLSDTGDREIFGRLLATADVLIFNMAPPTADRLGLTPEYFAREHPSLVACQISGYGRRGRASGRRAYDMLLQAETGLLDATGDDAGPVRIGVSLSDIGTGIYASSLILGALYERTRTGQGRHIDLSMFEAMMEFAGPNLTAFANSGVRYARSRSRHHNIVPYGVFECRDGFIALAIEQDREWDLFCRAALQRDDLAEDPGFRSNAQRVARRAEVERAVERELRARPVAEWRDRFESLGLAYGMINDVEKVWKHNAAHDLGLHGTAELRDGTQVAVPVSPAERAFHRVDAARIPELDEHRAEVIAEVASKLAG